MYFLYGVLLVINALPTAYHCRTLFYHSSALGNISLQMNASPKERNLWIFDIYFQTTHTILSILLSCSEFTDFFGSSLGSS